MTKRVSENSRMKSISGGGGGGERRRSAPHFVFSVHGGKNENELFFKDEALKKLSEGAILANS